ncbi:redoxin domain-containing protein [Mesorhizobium sp. B3-2-1]|nr:redoxin domain-containing protein [Mesorhizobium sp. B3-2-1]
MPHISWNGYFLFRQSRSGYGYAETKKISGAPCVRAGDRAPDFTLTTHGGQPVSLTAELQKEPVMLLLLGLYATTRCRHSARGPVKLRGQIGTEGGVLLAISSAVMPRSGSARTFPCCTTPALSRGVMEFRRPLPLSSAIVLSLIDVAPGNRLTGALWALRCIGVRRS